MFLNLRVDVLAQLPTHVVQAIAHHVHDAQLLGRLGVCHLYILGIPLQAIHAGNEDILNPTVLELGHHLEPELGPLILGNP